MLTKDEREWVAAGMAWVGLVRWAAGPPAGDAARRWFQEQMDIRFDAKHAARMMGAGMQCLAVETAGRVLAGCLAPGDAEGCGKGAAASLALAGATMPGFGPAFGAVA